MPGLRGCQIKRATKPAPAMVFELSCARMGHRTEMPSETVGELTQREKGTGRAAAAATREAANERGEPSGARYAARRPQSRDEPSYVKRQCVVKSKGICAWPEVVRRPAATRPLVFSSGTGAPRSAAEAWHAGARTFRWPARGAAARGLRGGTADEDNGWVPGAPGGRHLFATYGQVPAAARARRGERVTRTLRGFTLHRTAEGPPSPARGTGRDARDDDAIAGRTRAVARCRITPRALS